MITIVVHNGETLESYYSDRFPKLNVGETFTFKEAYKETIVERGSYTVKSIEHVSIKRKYSTDLTTIINLIKK